MRHAVIMAGGSGVRLWPLSRKNRPKQVLKLFSGTSLLRQSYERVAALLPPEQIHVITNEQHLAMVAEELPELPAANLIGEPMGRDTAAAVALSAAVISQSDPDATVGIFTADHIITPVETFRETLGLAFTTAEEQSDALVTMGVRMTRPDTNYGYVHRGSRVTFGVYEVLNFAEKPTAENAQTYMASGEYYWNSGMFTWRASTILAQLEEHLPQSYGPIMEIAAAWRTDQGKSKLKEIYPNLQKISIDFAVMERAPRVLVVELDCGWVDVGAWTAVESVVEPDADQNVAIGNEVIHLGSTGMVVVSEDKHLIATLGVSDLVIVHAPDATLICNKHEATGIKKLVEDIKERFGDEYL